MKFRVKTPRIFFFTLLFLLGTALGIAAIVEDSDQIYSALQKAFYLSAQDAVWVRPGLNVQIVDVKIPLDRKPVVIFRLTDDKGQALDREGNLTPGPVGMSFIMAYIPQNASQYVDYSTRAATNPTTKFTTQQAGTDSGGTYYDFGDGSYQYAFGTVIPADFDNTATHTLGIYATRDLREFGLSFCVDNETKSFVPNGSAVTKIRDVVPTTACNQCHDPLSAHGETGRRNVEICILCHTPQTLDPDSMNTVDMKVMIHKIHRGENLPSVQAGHPYQIIGRGGVADFSTVVFPQDMRNCTTCHQAPAQEVNNWLLNPTADACGSCHDDVNFKTGADHPGGPQSSDRDCARCHWPQGMDEFDSSIAGAHTVPYKSTQLRYPKFDITGITNTAPGQKPVVQFKITDKDGAAITPSTMSRLSLMIGGPTTDYTWTVRETATGASYANGMATYTFTGAIPSDAKGTYAVEIEGYINATLNPGQTNALNQRDAGINVVKSFAVTGTTVTPRRGVVDIAKCNKCHDQLQLHGGNRNQITACVMCHNPTATASVSGGGPNESIDLRVMVHKIHTGEALEGEYKIGTSSFNEVRFPGDRRDCLACHVGPPSMPASYTVPLPSTDIPVTTPRDLWTPTLPTAAACLGCHDSVAAAAHAFLNTAAIGGTSFESCSVCHKESADFAVSQVHAR